MVVDCEIRPFENCIRKVKYTNKIASQDFKESGRFPIVSQEESFISGYWDNPKDVFYIDGPIVVFGDHSRHIKYVDFDFVIGADGVKILAPVKDVNAKYLYYYLKGQPIQSLGYSRHYKVLKEKKVPVPSLADQLRIVDELDLLAGIIDKKNAQLSDLDALAQSIFYEMFGDPDRNEKGWDAKTLKEVCSKLYAGGDVPKERFSKQRTSQYTIPILSNGKGASALYGFTDLPRETSPAITISGRGTIGYSTVQIKPFYPIIRLIVAVPLQDINIIYLQKHLSLMTFESTGGAIPQLTIPMVKDRHIIVPPLPLQEEYAAKIQSIENQYHRISMALKDAETLLQSRMDYWFD